MQRSQLHIYQLLGIVVLAFIHLFGSRKASQSEMHFDVKQHHYMASFHKDHNLPGKHAGKTTHKKEDQHKHHKRTRSIQNFSVFTTPVQIADPKVEVVLNDSVKHGMAEAYYFLFFKEINPPPPKAC